MADRGAAGITIVEITEAADVGFGTFYNHFPSKEAIYKALIVELIGQFGGTLDRLSDHMSDPAERISACIRYVVRRGRQDPLWGRFVVRSGFTADGISAGMGRYLIKDLAAGIKQSRFRIDDTTATFIAVGSVVLGALAAEHELQAGHRLPAPLMQNTQEMGERISTLVLQLLGLSSTEANLVARRPLPSIELPPNPFSSAVNETLR